MALLRARRRATFSDLVASIQDLRPPIGRCPTSVTVTTEELMGIWAESRGAASSLEVTLAGLAESP